MATSKENLIKALDDLLKQMEAKGMVSGLSPNKKERENLIHTIADNILSTRPNISKEDLKSPPFQKTLAISILSQHLTNKMPDFKFDYKNLFAFNKPELLLDDKTKNAKENELKNVFKMLLTKLNKLEPDKKKRLTEKNIDALAAYMAKKCLNNYMGQQKQMSMQENNSILNTLGEFLLEMSLTKLILDKLNKNTDKKNEDKLLESSLVELYGGDPRFAGKITGPVRHITGNLYGIADYSGANEASNAFMDELKTIGTCSVLARITAKSRA